MSSVLGEVVRHYDGGIRTISAKLAALIVKIRRAAPGIPPMAAYRMAMRYRHRLDAPPPETREHDDPHRELDLYLALGLWDPRLEAEAFARGWINTIGGENPYLNEAIGRLPGPKGQRGTDADRLITESLRQVLKLEDQNNG